ncbi:NAD(P)-binding protein [Calocera cornea HHB12733]|uniref:NAD(P)-binding protein n=1 Tax=Calocera cornea HHB12733 TaxID=1353952 RepID=A0A165BZQ4_9BASI|nr:NAD(P)-binding protein [Calocera cornea HHB12733]
MAPTVYLISGANRGIGLGLVQQLAARENVVVFAGVRNPSAAKDLQALEVSHPGKIYTVKLTSVNKEDNEAAVQKIKTVAGRLDVVIANAGVGDSYAPSDKVPLDDMRSHYEVNVLGPLVLFQAAWPLLKASQTPKFIVVSSLAGSIEVATKLPMPIMAYGVSKAAVNWLAAKLWYEYPELISLPVHPGSVRTDMAKNGLAKLPEAFGQISMITIEEGAKGVLSVIDAAKRDEAGPTFLSYDGTVLPW